MANSLELELRQILLNPPEPPFFNQGEVIKGLVRPENLGIVDLDTARNLVFRGQEKLHYDWQLSRGIDGLEVEVLDWLDLPYSARLRTVIERTIIIPDSFCGRLVCNPSFRRLFEIFQWGPKRDEPATNPQNRGGHTIEFLALFNRSVNILWEKQKDLLVKIIRRDLSQFTDTEALTPEEIFILYKKIGFTAVCFHDIATPAAGDAIKPLLVGSNGGVYDEALEVDSFLAMSQHSCLKRIIEEEGLSPYFKIILDVIAGRSNSLLGQFIAPVDSSRLKLDTIAYLLYDASWFHFLRHIVPGIEIAGDQDRNLDTFLQRLSLLSSDLVNENENVMIGGYSNRLSVPLQWLNVVPSVFLTEEGELGYADNEGLSMLLFLNAVMSLDAFQGPKMLVIEDQIQKYISNLPVQAKNNLLKRNLILTIGTRDFYKELERLVGADLTKYLYVNGSYRRYLLPKKDFSLADMQSLKQKYPDLHLFPGAGLKPRLGTLTQNGGEICNYKNLFPNFAEELEKMRRGFESNWTAMVDLDEADNDLQAFLNQFSFHSALYFMK